MPHGVNELTWIKDRANQLILGAKFLRGLPNSKVMFSALNLYQLLIRRRALNGILHIRLCTIFVWKSFMARVKSNCGIPVNSRRQFHLALLPSLPPVSVPTDIYWCIMLNFISDQGCPTLSLYSWKPTRSCRALWKLGCSGVHKVPWPGWTSSRGQERWSHSSKSVGEVGEEGQVSFFFLFNLRLWFC